MKIPVLAALAVVLLLVSPSSAAASDVYSVPFKGRAQLAAYAEAGLDVLGFDREHGLMVAARPDQRAQLAFAGVEPRLVQAGREPSMDKGPGPTLGLYHTYAEMETALQGLASTYPTLAELSVFGTSIEGRNLYVLKISDNVTVDEAEAECLLAGNLHSRELMSVEIPLRTAEYLLQNYGLDPAVTDLVDNREIFVMPMLNPDGHVYVEQNNAGDWWTWWRKNRRDNGNGTTGVDLNRNFDYQWGLDDQGSSPNPSSLVYRGTSGFSEPETAAFAAWTANRDLTIAFSYHSYGELLLYPWGYTYDFTVDHELFYTLGQDLTSTNGYYAGNPAMGAIYLTNGGSDDWAYGETTTKPSYLSFTPEVNSFSQGGFGPPDTQIDPTFNLLLPMNLRMIELADEPRKVLGPTAPVLSPLAFSAPEVTVSWSDNDPQDPNPVASWEVVQFTDLGHDPVDNAEVASPWWSFDGFSVSGSAASQGSSSYYSGSGDDLQNSLTSTTIYRVTPSTSTFTCQMNYQIELDWDYAYVMVSEDAGLTWSSVPGNVTTNTDPNGNNLGHGITGNSGGWVAASFDLSAYDGQDILLRIAYVTDGAVVEPGLWVDELGPVATHADETVVAAAHPTNSLTLPLSSPASYTYRVRARDAEGDVGRWSNTETALLDPVTATQEVPRRASYLAANHPNPFNPSTLLPFVVGSNGDVTRRVELTLYDAAGRVVARLVDGPMDVGAHRVRWDGLGDGGRRMPSGVYRARLTVDGEEAGRRNLVLLK